MNSNLYSLSLNIIITLSNFNYFLQIIFIQLNGIVSKVSFLYNNKKKFIVFIKCFHKL